MDTLQRIRSLIPVATTVHTAHCNGYSVNYVTAGHGPPLLLLHGANIGWIQWYNIIAPLAKKYTVFALDWPGSGHSTKIDFASTDIPAVYGSVLESFITKLKLKNICIIAHSVSGVMALNYAHKHPKNVRKLILVNSMGFTTHLPLNFYPVTLAPFAWFLSHIVIKPTRGSMSSFLYSVFRKPITLPEPFIDHFYQTVMKDRITHPIMFIHALTEVFRIKKALLQTDVLSSIHTHILVIHGQLDPLIPHDKMIKPVALLPNGTFYSMEGVGHVPSLEQPEEFLKKIVSFL